MLYWTYAFKKVMKQDSPGVVATAMRMKIKIYCMMNL